MSTLAVGSLQAGTPWQDTNTVHTHCRDGSRVLIEYTAQFSGERKPPAAAGRGFQQVKRSRKAQHGGAAAAQIAEATRGEASGVGHWMTAHQFGHRRKVSSLYKCP